jgi:hypothetical protein
MNGFKFLMVIVSFFILLMGCSSVETAISKHQLLCQRIIAESVWIYTSGADSLLAEDQYADFCHDLSTTQEMMANWILQLEAKK